MTKIDRNISEALGIEIDHEPTKELIVQEKPNTLPATIDHTKDIQEDYELARETFHGIIRIGSKALEDVAELARESESAKAYEVMATLMKSLSDTTKDMYSLQQRTKDLLGKDVPDEKKKIDETNINVEKAVFVGSTAELLKQIKEEEKNNV